MKFKVKKLEEFLDENIDNLNIKNKKYKKNNKILNEILNSESENEPNIEISIIKTKNKKALKISIELFADGEILNFDLEIDKDTFFELVKEME